MDGVFTLCRADPGCMRMDQHEGRCNIPVTVTRRPVASRLRYLAHEVGKEWNPTRQLAVQSALLDLAQELE